MQPSNNHEPTIHPIDSINPVVHDVGIQGNHTWAFTPRTIYDFELMYCFRGVAFCEIEDRKYEISRGDLLIVPPGKPHTFSLSQRNPAEIIWMHLDFFHYPDREWVSGNYLDLVRYQKLYTSKLKHPEYIREIPVFEPNIHLPELLRVQNQAKMATYFRQIHVAFLDPSPFARLVVKSIAVNIIHQIFLSLWTDEAIMNTNAYRVKQMLQFMQEHYFEPITVPEITAVTGLQRDYATRIFKEETGKTIVDMLNEFRLIQAQQLMLDMDLSLAEIAELTGFSSQNYLSTVCRKYYGTTPSKLREMALLSKEMASHRERINGELGEDDLYIP